MDSLGAIGRTYTCARLPVFPLPCPRKRPRNERATGLQQPACLAAVALLYYLQRGELVASSFRTLFPYGEASK